MVCIVILNWNGYKDTIECLQSIINSCYDDYFIVIGDNGSIDESLKKIEEFCSKLPIKFIRTNSAIYRDSAIEKKQIILLELMENHGFAKGNNLVIKHASYYKPDYYFLLNNDTIIDKYCLTKLTSFLNDYRTYHVITPRINYYYEKNRIWSCGGHLLWGFRKDFYSGKVIQNMNRKILNISFITGCALFFTPNILKDGKVFTEDFFFGEEDFEFSIRMKKQKINMACIFDAVVFHKVSASQSEFKNLNSIYIHYLNRFINVRKHMGHVEFFIWRCIYIPYIVYLLFHIGISFRKGYLLIKNIQKESYLMDCVSVKTFHEIMNR